MPGTTLCSSAEEFDRLILGHDLVIVSFTGSFSTPATLMQQPFDELSDVHGDKATFVEVDIGQLPKLGRDLCIAAVPLVFVYKAGKKIDEIGGMSAQKIISRLITKHLCAY